MLKRFVSFVLASIMVFSAGVMTVSASAPSDQPGPALVHKGSPSGITYTDEGFWLIADSWNRVIWRYKEGSAPELFAGLNTVLDLNGRPLAGYRDAQRLSSAFNTPWAIVPFMNGWLVSDTDNHVVRYVNSTQVQTACGSAEGSGLVDDIGINAKLNRPTGLAVDEEGNAYIADTGNNVIRKLDTVGNVTTFAGAPWNATAEQYADDFETYYKNGFKDGTAATAKFNQPTGLYWFEGVLYIADSGNHKIRKVQNGVVSTVAGVTFPAEEAAAAALGFTADAAITGGFKDAAAANAEFSNPQGVVVDKDGSVYVADSGNSAIRVIKNGNVTTMIVPNLEDGDTYPVSPRGLMIKNDTLYITDVYAGVVFVPLTSAGLTYDDVNKSGWYATAVSYVSTRGIMVGGSNNMFLPATLMNRAMAIHSVGNFHKRVVDTNAVIEGNSGYADVTPGSYYDADIVWAESLGIKLRTSGDKFSPAQAITREEYVTLLFQYAKGIGLDVSFNPEAIDGFDDTTSISADARDAIAWALSNNIMSSNTSSLRPLATLNRAEISQLFMTFANHYGY